MNIPGVYSSGPKQNKSRLAQAKRGRENFRIPRVALPEARRPENRKMGLVDEATLVLRLPEEWPSTLLFEGKTFVAWLISLVRN